MSDNERDELWNLLGKAREPKVSPFFARNVLRAVRQGKPERTSFLPHWMRFLLRPVSLGVAALALAGVIAVVERTPHSAKGVEPSASADVLREDDLQIVAELDVLLASQDNELWANVETSF